MLANLEAITCVRCNAVGMYTTTDPVELSSRVEDRAVLRHGCICREVVADRRIFAVIDESPSKAETRTRGRKLENA